MSLYGIIGYNVLKDYEIFIDFHLKQITLSRINKNGDKIDKSSYLEKVTDTINFTLKKYIIILTFYVNNQRLNFGLNTRAEINLLDKSVSKKVFKNFITLKRIIMTGVGKRKIDVLAGKLHRVKLTDNIYCGIHVTIITYLDNMKVTSGTKLGGGLSL